METIIKILSENNNRIDFDSPVTVKMTPHQPPEKVVSVQTDGFNIFYTNQDGVNKFLSEKSIYIINSIRQRLLWLRHEKKV